MRDFKTCICELYRYSRIVRSWTLICVFIGLIRIAASLSFVIVCKNLVDIATGAVEKPFTPYVFAFIGIIVAQLLLSASYNYIESINSIKTQIKLRRSLYSHVLNSQWKGQEVFHSGDAINRLEQDVSTIVGFCCSGLPNLIVTLCQLLAAAVYLLMIAPNLLWVLLALMIFALLGSRLFFNTFRSLTNAIRAKDSDIQAHLQETLQNRIVVLTIAGTKRMVERLACLQKGLYDYVIKRLNYGTIAHIFIGFGFASGYAVTFLWGVFGILEGTVTFGMMTAFLQLVGQVQRPVASLAKAIPSFIRIISSVERLMDLQDLPLEKDYNPMPIKEVPEIEVRHLTFSYPNQQKKVFDDFSVRFHAGTLTAIIGETGAGKSTLTRLLLALLEPESGEIIIGGHSADVNLRCNFMYIPQGNSLFSGTIRDNLLMAKPDATEEEMKGVLHRAMADFVLNLPQGIDSSCSERGGGLSEGQAQRIAIARGLLHDGNILILDEATSALDTETEKLLLQNLKQHYHGMKTILFISHREAVIAEADEVVRIS